MSTRATIARTTEGNAFRGRYNHFDGYPSGVGMGIIRAIGHYGLNRAKQILLDEHPAGWSNVATCDWSKEIGYVEDLYAKDQDRPQCYCHGDRNEEGWMVDSVADADNMSIEWAYFFNDADDTLKVYEHNDSKWEWRGTVDLTSRLGHKSEIQMARIQENLDKSLSLTA